MGIICKEGKTLRVFKLLIITNNPKDVVSRIKEMEGVKLTHTRTEFAGFELAVIAEIETTIDIDCVLETIKQLESVKKVKILPQTEPVRYYERKKKRPSAWGPDWED